MVLLGIVGVAAAALGVVVTVTVDAAVVVVGRSVGRSVGWLIGVDGVAAVGVDSNCCCG